MEIKILYDNNAGDSNILAGWGFSCLVDGSVLFDTGEDGTSLLQNMKEMAIDVSYVKDVVISHDHADHTGGLKKILERNKGVRVHACRGFSEGFKKNVKALGGVLVEHDNFAEIGKNILVTGEIEGRYKEREIAEQALIAKTSKGVSVVTGCAHPGIVTITKKVRERFPDEKIYCIFGGFHLKGKQTEEIIYVIDKLKNLGAGKAGPAHCSGEKAINVFKERFGRDFIHVAAGKKFEV
ncbi:MAG: MBL fold metallo-hydrolase [Candidatus Tantalella remota]|nr:MBL fold metallo-hydrolase [Candidatus Tantalella remota]